MSLGLPDEPPLSEQARRRLAKRMGCAPDEVEEECRRRDDVSWVGNMEAALTEAIGVESKAVCNEISAGARLTEEAVLKRFLIAWCLGRVKANTGQEEAASEGEDAPAPAEPPVIHDAQSAATGAEIDLRGTFQALQAATTDELAKIEQDIAAGLDVGDKEIRARLDVALRSLKFALAAIVIPLWSILAGLADEPSAPWPQKGDTIYVAAKLEGFNNPMVVIGGLGGKMPDVPTLEPCAPTTLRSRSDEADRFTIRDDMHNDRKLIGEWLPRFHKTAKECQAQAQSSGLPRVQMTGGWKYTLVPEPVEK